MPWKSTLWFYTTVRFLFWISSYFWHQGFIPELREGGHGWDRLNLKISCWGWMTDTCWLTNLSIFLCLKVSIIQRPGTHNTKKQTNKKTLSKWEENTRLALLQDSFLQSLAYGNCFHTISLGLRENLQEMKLSRGTQSSVKIKENEPERKCCQEGYHWEDPWHWGHEQWEALISSTVWNLFPQSNTIYFKQYVFSNFETAEVKTLRETKWVNKQDPLVGGCLAGREIKTER